MAELPKRVLEPKAGVESPESISFPAEASALFEAHRIGGRPVMPAALILDFMRDRCDGSRAVVGLRDLLFLAPVFADDRISLAETPDDGGGHEFRITKNSDANDKGTVIEGAIQPLRRHRVDNGDSAPLQADESRTFDVEQFYSELAAEGNEFGKPLRLIVEGVTSPERFLASLDSDGASFAAMLDACLHAPLAFRRPAVGPFAIHSIGEVQLWNDKAGIARLDASLLERRDDESFDVDLVATDDQGDLVAHFQRVRYCKFELPARATLAIASNITLDPLQEAYDSLAEPLKLAVDIAPFDQIYQTLLAGGGPTVSDATQELVLLVDLAKWDETDRLNVEEDRVQEISDAGHRTLLPNGTEVFGINRYETDYLYEEIFDGRTYLARGVSVAPGDVVLDIGANIGMFSLHVLDLCPEARIFAFEPSPVTAALLSANLGGRGDVTVSATGVADIPGSALFTHYETSSVFSGFHVDTAEDRRTIERVIENRVAREVGAPDVDEYVHDLAEDRLRSRQTEVRITTVSEVIDEYDLDSIGLLKIDAEKSEDAILRGIRDEHWPLIHQAVLEIHDPEGDRLAEVHAFMEQRGFSVSVHEEQDLERAGLYSMTAVRQPAKRLPSIGRNYRSLRAHFEELRDALSTFRSMSETMVSVVVVSSNSAYDAGTHLSRQYRQAIAAFRRMTSDIEGISVVNGSAIERQYPGAGSGGQTAIHEAGMPFALRWYAATAMWLLRRHVSRIVKGKKVLVVDCDNTLWRGLCAEEGPRGVEIPEAFRNWQKRLLELRKAGAIICLCSRNVPDDVMAVFEQHSGMVLSRDDITLAKIGWKPKSELIAEIIGELDLAAESVVFVDDNPAECAEVEMAHPDVACLRFPDQESEVDAFNRHTWIFDWFATGGTGLDRTRLYQQEWRRKEFRKSQYSLEEFIEGLQLEISLRRATAGDLERISELSRRTNQFNMSGDVRSVPELDALLQKPSSEAWVVHVRDRFGDYGLAGALYGALEDHTFLLTNFLLSCRVLGRGVEQRIVALLADELEASGIQYCGLRAVRTERNVPAMRLYTAIAGEETPPERIQVELSRLRGLPVALSEKEPGPTRSNKTRAGSVQSPVEQALRDAQRSERIRELSRDAASIERAVWGSIGPMDEEEIGETPEERAIAGLWRHVMGRAPRTRDSDFFAEGGSSLQLVRLVSEIKRRYCIPFRLSEAYGRSTPASLATIVVQRIGEIGSNDSDQSEDNRPVLAPIQSGLWFIQNLDEGTTMYNVPIAICVDGPLDPQLVNARLQQLVQKHRVLASRYRLHGRETLVNIDTQAEIPFEVLEGHEWTQAELLEQCVKRTTQPINLTQGPVLRASLVQWSKGRTVLALFTHHMMADLESLELLLREVLEPDSLDPVDPGAYWQFANWHQRVLEGDSKEALEQFWRHELSDLPKGLFDTAGEHDRARGASSNGAFFTHVDRNTYDKLRSLGRKHGVSLFTVLLSVKAMLTRDFFDRSDIVIGTPASLRDSVDVDCATAVGNFVNLLPIRFQLDSGSFVAALKIAQSALERCMEHKELPFHSMVNRFGRRPDRSALVETILSYHAEDGDIPIGEIVRHGHMSRPFELGGRSCALLGIRQQIGQADIGIELFECAEGLGINVKHAGRRFSADDARRFANRYAELLQAISPAD